MTDVRRRDDRRLAFEWRTSVILVISVGNFYDIQTIDLQHTNKILILVRFRL